MPINIFALQYILPDAGRDKMNGEDNRCRAWCTCRRRSCHRDHDQVREGHGWANFQRCDSGLDVRTVAAKGETKECMDCRDACWAQLQLEVGRGA